VETSDVWSLYAATQTLSAGNYCHRKPLKPCIPYGSHETVVPKVSGAEPGTDPPTCLQLTRGEGELGVSRSSHN